MNKNVAIFASGEGSNAQNIIDYFKGSKNIKIALVVSNKVTANVLNRAKKSNIPTLILERNKFFETREVIQQLTNAKIDLIVLAGFLWMIPESLVHAFPNKIINIHPALLPKFGGQGMYGMNVHKAVIEAKEMESGISIHFVNEHYDKGQIIASYTCPINSEETPETLAEKIHEMEYKYLPKTIEDLLN